VKKNRSKGEFKTKTPGEQQSCRTVFDTEQEKRATCERLKSARGAVFLIVFLAAPFSNRFVRCLVPV
jgi:hypothetical protein